VLTVNAGHAGPVRLSDSGSRMGAGRLGQTASDAVIVTVRRPLTCADAATRPVWPVEHRIRIEGVRGSCKGLRCLISAGFQGCMSIPGWSGRWRRLGSEAGVLHRVSRI
jgi:hypothetical protein